MKTKWNFVLGIITVLMALMITSCSDEDTSTSTATTTTETAVKPSASPAGGNYEATQTVTLTTATSGAKIYYTLDGNTPTTGSDEYSAPIQITHTATLKAIAVKFGMNNSDVLTEHYIITPPGQVVQPAASPEGGNFAATQTVTLTSLTEGAAIYYTLDGNEPSTNSNVYTSPITIEQTTTLKAIAVKASMHDSDVLTEHYIITPPGQVVQPAASPEGGNFAATQTVTLTSLTEGAAIYYTLDETEPTTASSQYASPITIEHTTTLKAIAVKTDMHDSDIMTEHYIITPPGQVVQPSVNIHDGTYFRNQIVTLSTLTEGAAIYYTLDGTEPTSASIFYISPINISITTTLKAFAVKEGMHDSDVLTVNYTIVPSFTDLVTISQYLSEHTGTILHPINLPVKIDLGTMTSAGSGWRQLLDIIAQADEFVNLILSECSMDGTEFNPDANVATGKDKIVSIALPDTATNIANGTSSNPTFKNFTELKLFSAEGLTSIGNQAFNGCTNLALTSLPAGITSIGSNAFYECTNLALTSLPEGLTNINDGVFGRTNIALTSLPAGITSIGYIAFSGCINLALTSLPEGLTSIGARAFFLCSNLALTSLPEGLTFIGGMAFGYSSVNINSFPASLVEIYGGAFAGCQINNPIICFAEKPPTVRGQNNVQWSNPYYDIYDIFSDVYGNSPSEHILRIEVPTGSVEAYKAAEGWSMYADRIFAITP